MHNKPKILFITTSIFSHVVPTFHVARILSKAYTVVYAVPNQALIQLVQNQGYESMLISARSFSDGFGLLELYDTGGFTNNHVPFWKAFLFNLSNKTFNKRKNELKSVIEQVQPKAIFIDMFSSTDFIAMYKFNKRIKFIFYSPMLSTYSIDESPLVSQENWYSSVDNSPQKKRVNSLSLMNKLYKAVHYLTGLNPSMMLYYNYIKEGVIFTNPRSKKNPYLFTFRNTKEIFLAPSELEFSCKTRLPDQFYLGFCIDEDTDLLQDETTHLQIPEHSETDTGKLIFCSFGTYFSTPGDHKKVANFILALIESVADLSDATLIVASNSLINGIIRESVSIPSHIHLTNRVEQREILQKCDLFITHGGLGSLKEAIFYSVPVLVFPLDMTWDQPGNALKVVYHHIGLRGKIDQIEPSELRNMIDLILNDPKYTDNVANFSRMIKSNYSDDTVDVTLKELIN